MAVHIQKNGYLTIHQMMNDVVADMVAAGFELKFPATADDLDSEEGNYGFDLLGASTTKARWCAILEANAEAVNAKDADVWVIKFEWDINADKDGMLDIIVGTPTQFNYTTGKHTYYTAKYMSSQKRVIVSGDSQKVDKAYDYKEVLGLLGTSFRNDAAIITYPDFIVKGSKQNFDSVKTSGTPISGTNPDYPNGEEDLVVNYRTIAAEMIPVFASVDVANISSSFSTLLGAPGDASSAKVTYASDWDPTSAHRLEEGTHIKHQDITYKVKSTITNSSENAIVSATETSIFVDGIPASVANKKYLVDGTKLFKTITSVNTIKILLDVPSTINRDVAGKWYKTATQVVKFYTNAPAGSPFFNMGSGSSWDPSVSASFITNTVISADNRETYGIQEFYARDLDIPQVAAALNLVYVKPLTTTNLTPETADSFSMEALSSSLAPVYTYEAVADRLYQIVSLVDRFGTAATPVTTFPTSTAESFVHGAYNLSYIGKYSDFLASETIGSSYYDTFEAEDEDGYDTRLVDGDFSYPAVLRNRNRSSKMFFNREFVALTEIAAAPIAYSMSVTDRGIVLAVNEETSDEAGNRNSWVVIQRPVDHVSGEVYVAGKSPVHCMYSIMSRHTNKPWLQEDLLRGTVDVGYTLRKAISTTDGISLVEGDTFSIFVPAPEAVSVRRFVVREADITAPYPTHVYTKSAYGVNLDYANGGFPFGVPADRHTPDYNAVINTRQQVAISEGNKYVITFPNGFNTARYAYTHEMDMIAYTSADVISAGTEIDITAYGETRTYIALQSNGPNNSGMRVLVLKEGGGIV